MASSCLCSTAHCSDRDERLACALDSGLDLYGYISLLVVVVDLSGSVLSCADVWMLGGACDGAPIYNPCIGVEYAWSVRVRRGSQACVRDHQLKTIDTYREPAAAGISQVKLVRVSSHRPVLETNCWVLACRSCADRLGIHMNIHRSGC